MRLTSVFFQLAVLQLGHLPVFSQAPQGVNFQGVARNPSGDPLPNKPISVRVSILKESETGPAEYTETHAVTTTAQGLFNLVIGKGLPTSGSFAAINWAAATKKFFKLEIDANGGKSYTLLGTQQLLSVPYALYAEKTRLTAGTGIAISNNSTIENAAPDKMVTLQGSGAATVTGTYPNFNVSSTDAQQLSLNGTQLSLTNGGSVTLSTQTPWVASGNNIHYSGGNVGIGVANPTTAKLEVDGDIKLPGGTGASLFFGSANITRFIKNDPGTDDIHFRAAEFKFHTYENVPTYPGWIWFDYGHQNGTTFRRFTLNMRNAWLGIGNENPKSSVHITSGDVYIENASRSVIMKSPNGQCWRMTVSDTGTPVFTLMSCP